MRGRWTRAVVMTALLVLLGGCALPNCSPKATNTAATTPVSSPSSSPTDSGSTATASPSAEATPSEAPSPSPSPSPPPLVITRQSLPLHIGEVGIAYSPASLGASGGTPPYAWSIGGGALPAGLSLSSGGSISGTPTAAGTASFALLLKDSAGAAAGYAASINILPALTATGLCSATQCSVEGGCVTVCGVFGQIGGGVQPYTFSLTQGSPPKGMTLNGLSLSGAFPSPPLVATAAPAPVLYSFTVGVTDALGATGSVSAAFSVYPHIFMTSGTIPVNPQIPCSYLGAPDPGCIAQFPYFGGTPNAGAVTATATWKSYTCAVAPPLPTVTAAKGQVLVSVPNGGSCSSGWSGTLLVVLTNQDPCAPGPVACASQAAPIDITQLTS